MHQIHYIILFLFCINYWFCAWHSSENDLLAPGQDMTPLLIKAKAASTPEEAIALCSRIIAADSLQADAFYVRGKAWEQLGITEDARLDLKKAFSLDTTLGQIFASAPAAVLSTTPSSELGNIPNTDKFFWQQKSPRGNENDTGHARNGSDRSEYTALSTHSDTSQNTNTDTDQVREKSTPVRPAREGTNHANQLTKEKVVFKDHDPITQDIPPINQAIDQDILVSTTINRRPPTHSLTGRIDQRTQSRSEQRESPAPSRLRVQKKEATSGTGQHQHSSVQTRQEQMKKAREEQNERILAQIKKTNARPDTATSAIPLVACEETIKHDPHNIEAIFCVGDALYKSGRYDDAISYYTRAIKLDAPGNRAYISRAKALGAKGRYRRALRDINRAVRVNPIHAKSYSVRAWVYHCLGKRKREETDLKMALRLGYHNQNFLKLRLEMLEESAK